MTEASQDRVIVVGAGIIGIAAAHYLAASGKQVTLLDQGTVGGACSEGNCGYICPSHVLPLTEPSAIGEGLRSLFKPDAPFRIKLSTRSEQWRWLWEFGRRCTHKQALKGGRHLKEILYASMQQYRALRTETGIDGEWQDAGLLYLLETQQGVRDFERTANVLEKDFDIPPVRISGDDLQQFDPALKTGLAGGFFYPDDAMVRPEVLCAEWASFLQTQGVAIVEHCGVTDVEKSAGRITALLTTAGPMEAEAYVFAMGAWSPKLSAALECRIPVEVGKGYSITMTSPAHSPTQPMLFPEHRVGVSPFASGYRLGSMMEFVGYDTSIPQRRLQQLRDSAVPYLREPYTDGVTSTWYGWRPMTWDSLPIIGRLPTLKNGILATGHNMLGMSTAPSTGRLVSEILDETKPHIDATAFSPQRFM